MAESYKDILRQIEELKAVAEQKRREEVAAAILEIKQKMAEYGITARDLGFSERKRTRRGEGRHAAEIKYRDPVSGAGWSGLGRKPKWLIEALQQGKSLNDFLVVPS